MIIKQKKVRSVDRYLNTLKFLKSVRVAIKITPDLQRAAIKSGFPETPENGYTVLPNIIGKVSGFNAEGEYVNLKDLPKKERYVTTIEWSWEQWRGRGQTETITEHRDIYKECYQRKFIEPPAVELTLINSDKGTFITSPEIVLNQRNKEKFKHTINLFLELFGECEIRKQDFSSFIPPQIKRVNWELLPAGKHPWDKVKSHTKSLLDKKHPRSSNVIIDRQDTIANYQPDEVYIGKGGFHSYIAYIFKERNIVILESILTGNATYVFGNDWEQFSMLTKAEILNQKLHKDRLIHSKGWENRLCLVLEPESLLAV